MNIALSSSCYVTLRTCAMGLCTFRKLSVAVLVIYVCVTFYTARQLLKQKLNSAFESTVTPVSLTSNVHGLQKGHYIAHVSSDHFDGTASVAEVHRLNNSRTIQKTIDIWSKAAIGNYFWEHIFESSIEEQSRMYSYGESNVNDISFRFYTGPGIVPQSMSTGAGGIVLIANGREQVKISLATRWLDRIVEKSVQFNNVAVVLLGNEQCNNSWIMKYMVSAGGPVKVVFITYDSPEIDDQQFFQWPLGVATYRSFPVQPLLLQSVTYMRKYRCNFLGTVYNNSSRETLLQVLNGSALDGECYVRARNTWLPQETAESMSKYVEVLRSSDLTLNAVGQNPECYRIYEAMACGSVPVVEDRSTADTCGTNVDSRRQVLALLKRHKAPVIYVSDWSQLPSILQRERLMTKSQILARRTNLVRWYAKFRRKMRNMFVSVIDQRFFTKDSSN